MLKTIEYPLSNLFPSGIFIGAQNSLPHFCAPMNIGCGLHRSCLDERGVASGQSFDFRSTKFFFFFLVGRNSASFAPPARCKSFEHSQMECGSGAKLTEFRPGGGTKPPQVGRNWSGTSRLAHQLSKIPPHTFGQLMRFGHTKHPSAAGAHR